MPVLPPLSRRRLLQAAGAAALLPLLPRAAWAEAPPRRLVARTGSAALLGPPRLPVAVWGYDGTVPGTELRFRQGERLRVAFVNELDVETTVHWHGLRLPHAMDGVPHLTQEPVPPGGSFLYEFDLPDAGTFWYHPHLGSAEQLERGLSGALVVEERTPPQVDRDEVWMIDDWRLDGAQLAADFGNLHDMSHAGRIGQLVTVNGRAAPVVSVRAGERVRLRLVNVANARIFRPRFEGHSATVIAYDGQPVAPHPAEDLVLGPGMRADVIIDMEGAPGSRHAVSDDFYRRSPSELATIVYAEEPPVREHPLDAPLALEPNPLPEPDLAAAETLEIRFEGGAMGRLREGMVDGRRMPLREMVQRHGLAWTLNGVAVHGHHHAPMAVLKRDATYRLRFVNDTAWHHPIHLHGHVFKLLGQPHAPWRDTILLAPEERAEVALVADNPGDWMLHCHVLEHQEGGMMGVLRVA